MQNLFSFIMRVFFVDDDSAESESEQKGKKKLG